MRRKTAFERCEVSFDLTGLMFGEFFHVHIDSKLTLSTTFAQQGRPRIETSRFRIVASSDSEAVEKSGVEDCRSNSGLHKPGAFDEGSFVFG